jgi:catechol 2,3-dioxygenase-like lactoylglutathione lyase family enzyme
VINLAGWLSFTQQATLLAEVARGELAMFPKLRVARPTDNVAALIPFYCDGLGLNILYQFKGHNGFDGVMIGRHDAPYHLEFTRAEGHRVGRAPSQDNLLVFYLPDPEDWQSAVARIKAAGFQPVPAFNSYWDEKGCTFEDPDGYRIVIQQASWGM